MLSKLQTHLVLRNSGNMKFSPRKAVLAGATALALSTTALTAAPAIAVEGQPAQNNTATFSSNISETFAGSSNDADTKESGTGAKETGNGSSTGEGGFNFDSFNKILKAISGVVGVASTIFAFLKSLKVI